MYLVFDVTKPEGLKNNQCWHESLKNPYWNIVVLVGGYISNCSWQVLEGNLELLYKYDEQTSVLIYGHIVLVGGYVCDCSCQAEESLKYCNTQATTVLHKQAAITMIYSSSRASVWS